ncbi:MAG: hypothetical protein AXW12_16455 [Thalassospira sp. Nap_22]|nr:MAG: hypothetical protein AXW12_16455 [Thalassospira sp. Nap_22]
MLLAWFDLVAVMMHVFAAFSALSGDCNELRQLASFGVVALQLIVLVAMALKQGTYDRAFGEHAGFIKLCQLEIRCV